MNKIKFNTPYNYEADKQRGENISGVSVTTQDMHYTVADLLRNYTSMPEILKQGIYEEDSNIDAPDPTRKLDFDLTDKIELEAELSDLQFRANKALQELANLKKKEKETKQSDNNVPKNDDETINDLEKS